MQESPRWVTRSSRHVSVEQLATNDHLATDVREVARPRFALRFHTVALHTSILSKQKYNFLRNFLTLQFD
jgi:hypothetical protein